MICTLKSRVTLYVALFFLFFGNSFAQLKEYPNWFIYPKDYPFISVGYTYSGNSAKVDAAIVKSAYRFCRIEGVLTFITKNDVNFPHRESDYHYEYSPIVTSKMFNNFTSGDSLCTSVIKNQYLGCYLSDTVNSIKTQMLKTRQLVKPDWVLRDPVEDEMNYFGVGIYTARGNENDAWKTAEERAIFGILLRKEYEIRSRTTIETTSKPVDGQVEKVISIKVNYYLENIKVVERFPDEENQLYYVLIKIPKGGITVPEPD